MIDVGGFKNTRARPAILAWQDKKGVYEQKCRELAAEIHWDVGAVCFVWSDIAEKRQKENNEPQAIAEFLAMRDVREALDGRGREPS